MQCSKSVLSFLQAKNLLKMAIESRLDPQKQGYSNRAQRKAAEGRGVIGEMHSQSKGRHITEWQVRGLVWVQVCSEVTRLTCSADRWEEAF